MYPSLSIVFHRILTIVLVSSMACLSVHSVHANQITVVSDTTGCIGWDTEEAEDESTITGTFSEPTQDDSHEFIGWLDGWMLLLAGIPLLLTFLSMIVPVLAILLVIYLIMRQRKKEDVYPTATTAQEDIVMDTEKKEKKDKLIMHLAVSGTIAFCSFLFGWKLLALGAMIYATIEGVRLFRLTHDDNY